MAESSSAPRSASRSQTIGDKFTSTGVSYVDNPGMGGEGQQAGHGGGSSAHRKKAMLMKLHAEEYWWTLAGFIGVLTIAHITDLISNYIMIYLTSPRSSDIEKSPSTQSPRSSSLLARVWRAIKSSANIVLFRITLPFQPLHNINNVAEAILVLAYMGAIVAWALVGNDLNMPSVSQTFFLSL